ncbi:4a-hydroxytetrahydrobiopterin dehydratase [Rhodococcus sp. ACS1]|jgi:4a-hydroxytetrahydrobiopterin dehydratase|uniref:Putative pterin-4-alpha-carbinolamine dehydratase n=3 Tax=Rhodococcus TaxID=1827 RepID=C1AZG7_RHOOB|nr:MULTISPECIES: 4a-hydroxytetrahydrobiopterin dehydratase [Rhodococcus]KAF0958590.1 putative pterin-4-alpha-carbinolamine dehydratase [Rhodococcus sp. T7]MDF3310823.1 4a-hydroxytetrahydrobiopterin dehydratase [Rhodococcus sp. T2V]OUS95966.1 4a-hydroxytetrahydrobiopterin dehydratase [Rhodococcus sp. NCIMB 12038]PBC50652.1 4a-hydroxytetrahydrobiopterin dehydratase [Rhodococcus sp. ACS1]QSE83520.1 4a-hydroxytetrahydrobiopterin dehydratase [Rhodococcus koreensis]
MAELLSDGEIDTALAGLPGWQRAGDSLVRTVESPSFPEAVELVRKVAEAAEAANHHPDIDIRWRKVTYTLSTHSAGGLTQLDLDLAAQIDSLAG